jgi:hypothetical protein
MDQNSSSFSGLAARGAWQSRRSRRQRSTRCRLVRRWHIRYHLGLPLGGWAPWLCHQSTPVPIGWRVRAAGDAIGPSASGSATSRRTDSSAAVAKQRTAPPAASKSNTSCTPAPCARARGVREGPFGANCQVPPDDLLRARPVAGGTLRAGRAWENDPLPAGEKSNDAVPQPNDDCPGDVLDRGTLATRMPRSGAYRLRRVACSAFHIRAP